MDFWKNHKLTVLLNEAPKPFLLVWFLIKDLIKYIFNLFETSWEGCKKALNKNVIIPSCIAAFFTMFIFSGFNFVTSRIDMSRDPGVMLFFIIIIINLIPISWGFSIVSSVISAKDKEEDGSWKNHIFIGFKSVKFFMTYMFLVGLMLGIITILSSFGLIPQIGQTALSLLSVPFYFMGLIIILSTLGILLGASLFGGHFLSGNYDESSSFTDRTKSLFCMVGRKILDWIAISIPNFLISFLFIIVPISLTVISIELIKSPSEGLYGVRFPDIYSSTTHHIQYPSEYEVNRIQDKFDAKKDKLAMNQQKFDRYSYDKQEFLDDLNNRWNDDEKWRFEKNKLVLNENDGWNSNSWIIKHDQVTYSQNDVITWESGKNSKVKFVGRYDYTFFIWLSGLALVFASSLILAVPVGCFYACSASTYYLLYKRTFKINIIKKILAIILLISIISLLFIGLAEQLGFFRYIF